MRTLLVSALALGAWTSAALAQPIALTDSQMDFLTAGDINQSNSFSATFDVTQTNSANESTVSGSISQGNGVTASFTVNQSNSADGATVGGGG
jgi:hypothetical protein